MCITPPLCIRGGKLWFLIPVEKTGAWLHKMLVFLVLVFFFSYFGYVFNQLNNNLLKFCPLTSEGFLILTFPVPLPFLCPYLQWVSHISSLPLHKFGSRKEKDHGDLSVPPHSHHFLTLWKAFFLVLSPFWARFWGRMGQGVFYLNLRWWIKALPPSPCPLQWLRCCLEEKWW